MFIYGGCGGNRNNFETKQECEKVCPFGRQYVTGNWSVKPKVKDYKIGVGGLKRSQRYKHVWHKIG